MSDDVLFIDNSSLLAPASLVSPAYLSTSDTGNHPPIS